MPKLRIASAQPAENGVVTVKVYSPNQRDAEGLQIVTNTLEYDLTKVPHPTLLLLACKGFSTFGEGRYTRNSPEEDLRDVKVELDALYTEMVKGEFTPGRAGGPSMPSAFHEALAQQLGVTVEYIQNEIKTKPEVFTKAQLAALRLDPRVSARVARIEADRAAAKLKAATEKAKGAKASEGTDSLLAAFAAGAPGAQAAAQ